MNKINVSAVSYTNTKPFVYGLTHSKIITKINLSLDTPAECAAKIIDDQADIGLVPVASLIRIPGYKIISNYCIGATGSVNSVFIFSNKPIEKIKSITLDSQSLTSNSLALVLIKNYWKIKPKIVDRDADAFVLIGDRTFGKKEDYKYWYDLAEEWFNFTSLPFAFAVWISKKNLNDKFIKEFNESLKLGLENRLEAIKNQTKVNFDLEDYLLYKLDYNLDDKKFLAINKFLALLQDL